MGLENAPKMSRPTDAEVTGTRPGIDPQRQRPKYPGAGAWALGLGIPAMCVWYIAPIVLIIGAVGIAQSSRTGDTRDRAYAITGVCLALLGVLLAGARLFTAAAASI